MENPPRKRRHETQRNRLGNMISTSAVQNDKGNGRDCLICFEKFHSTGKHRIVSLRCGHIFGRECIEKWVAVSKYLKKNHASACNF